MTGVGSTIAGLGAVEAELASAFFVVVVVVVVEVTVRVGKFLVVGAGAAGVAVGGVHVEDLYPAEVSAVVVDGAVVVLVVVVVEGLAADEGLNVSCCFHLALAAEALWLLESTFSFATAVVETEDGCEATVVEGFEDEVEVFVRLEREGEVVVLETTVGVV